MTTAQLFDVQTGDVTLTSDDWYTPRWIFDAAALVFDVDVCAPVDSTCRTCPAESYLTAVEDGLAQPWHGIVWMNPPYSGPAPWVERWSKHPDGLALTAIGRDASWLGVLLRSADAITMLSVRFIRPGSEPAGMRFPSLLSARGGAAVDALARVAAADRIMAGAYHVRPLAERAA